MIPFAKISMTEIEKKHMNEAINSNKICGDGEFTKKCTRVV